MQQSMYRENNRPLLIPRTLPLGLVTVLVIAISAGLATASANEGEESTGNGVPNMVFILADDK